MQRPQDIVLYYTPGACSLASHIALEESGLAFRGRHVWAEGELTRAEYLEVNPRGTVPALVADGAVLTESIAILHFIAGLAPELFPEDEWAQAQCLSRMAWFASTAHIAFRQTRRPERFTTDTQAFDAVRSAGHTAFRAALGEIEAMLRDASWIAGERFGVADGYALVFYGWGIWSAYDMGEYQAFTAFRDRCIARPAVRRVLERERSVILG